MELVFSIVLFAFGGAILLYAGIVAIGGYDAIFRNYATKVKDKKKYARKFAKLLALFGLSLVLGGAVALWRSWAGGVVLLAGVITTAMQANRLTGIVDELDMRDPDKEEKIL